MKKIDLKVLMIVLMAACTPKPETSTTEVQAEEAPAEPVEEVIQLTGNFGEKISTDGAMSMRDLLSQLADKDSVNLKVESEILATCAMKGCWMNVALNEDEHMRVTFKDYGFFVPKEGVEGKKVIFEGYAKRVVTDIETLQHFAKDAGKSQDEIEAITEPKQEITFIASGVIIE